MDSLHLTHLIALSAWGCLVLGEIALELLPRDDAALRTAARLHYAIDLLVELPLLLIVLTTGLWLAARTSLTWTLQVKIGAGLVAIAANLACGVCVVLRRRLTDGMALRTWRRRIILTAAIGIPFGLLAAVLGLSRLLR